MRETDDLSERFREFREAVRKLAAASARETEKHMRTDEVSLEIPFHDGETGSLEMALDYMDEILKEESPLSANGVEEAYFSLLLSYERMKGNLSALRRVIRTMQESFDLPGEEELEQG